MHKHRCINKHTHHIYKLNIYTPGYKDTSILRHTAHLYTPIRKKLGRKLEEEVFMGNLEAIF